MPKILRIAVTEYLNAIRSKAFILGIVMLPVFMFGGIVVSRFARDKTDIKDRSVAVLDYTRSLTPIIAAKAKEGQIMSLAQAFQIPHASAAGKQIC